MMFAILCLVRKGNSLWPFKTLKKLHQMKQVTIKAYCFSNSGTVTCVVIELRQSKATEGLFCEQASTAVIPLY